jgi:hypothetical protein
LLEQAAIDSTKTAASTKLISFFIVIPPKEIF